MGFFSILNGPAEYSKELWVLQILPESCFNFIWPIKDDDSEGMTDTVGETSFGLSLLCSPSYPPSSFLRKGATVFGSLQPTGRLNTSAIFAFLLVSISLTYWAGFGKEEWYCSCFQSLATAATDSAPCCFVASSAPSFETSEVGLDLLSKNCCDQKKDKSWWIWREAETFQWSL